MNDTGFIKISRKLFEHRYWNEPREYSRAEAWIDLIQSARFESSIVLLNGRDVEVRRGELVASRRFLEKRWKWSNTKVDNFLSDLAKSQMITRRSANGNAIITLTNYDTYNDANATKNAKETPPKRQSDASRTPKYKKEEERKEGKEVFVCAVGAPTEQQRQFYDSLKPFVGKYKPEMLRSFYNYWSELNKSGTKMRWQLQATWQIERRLEYWANRDNQIATQKNGTNQQQALDDLKLHVLGRVQDAVNGVDHYSESEAPL